MPDQSRDRLRRFGADLESAYPRGRADQLATRVMARAAALPPKRSFRAVLAGASLFLLGSSVVGVLADAAVPGEFLYRVDRAAESVGLGRGAVRERLREAIALAERGDTDGAKRIASEALVSIDPDMTVYAAGDADPSAAAAAAIETPADPDETIRVLTLAVQALLRSLDDESADLEAAVSDLALALNPVDSSTTSTSSTSTSSTSTSTTSTSTTSTTSTSSTSTTTSQPEDPSSTTTTTTTGGIILPPIP